MSVMRRDELPASHTARLGTRNILRSYEWICRGMDKEDHASHALLQSELHVTVDFLDVDEDHYELAHGI